MIPGGTGGRRKDGEPEQQEESTPADSEHKSGAAGAGGPGHVSDACETALALRRRDMYPVPMGRGEKGPTMEGWQDLRLSLDEIPDVFEENINVGLLTGEPSGGLDDVDLDAPEAVVIGRRWLPATGMQFGRASKRRSHWLYRVAGELRRETFTEPERHGGDKGMLLELRGTGHQTMAPGSEHPSGEIVEWDCSGEPAPIDLDDLRSVCGRVAAAALLARHWHPGQRHDATLPLAGLLLRHWTEEDTADFLDAMAEAVGADRQKVAADVRDTVSRLRAGDTVTGFPTLVSYFPQRVLEKAFEWLRLPKGTAAGVVAGAPDQRSWAVPGNLPSLTDPVPTLEPELIPEPFRDWVFDVADRMRVPCEYVALPATSAVASVVGRNIAIRPMARDNWAEVATLWGALVGGPGTLKTPAISAGLRPLHRLASIASEQFRQDRRAAEVDEAIRDAKLKATKEKMKAAAKKGAFSDFAALQKELEDLSAEADEEPTEKRYITNDATTEKLGELLRENPRGLLVVRDELIGWLDSFDRQGREADRAFYLEAWNGKGSFYVDRIQRGSLYVPALTLSVFGGIQPDRLRSFFSGAMANGGEMDGLLQRFQLIAFPDDLGDFKIVDRFPDDDAADRVFCVFRRLDLLKPNEVGAEMGDEDELPFLRFSADAQERFYVWYEPLMGRVRATEAQKTPGFTAHLAKYSSLAPKLALLFHLVEAVDGRTSGPVGIEAIERALKWTDYLELHARKVYAVEIKGNVAAAHALGEKIRAGAVSDRMTVRDVWRREWSGLKSSGQVYDALEVLGQVGWTRIEAEETGGRDRTIIRINPGLAKGTKK